MSKKKKEQVHLLSRGYIRTFNTQKQRRPVTSSSRTHDGKEGTFSLWRRALQTLLRPNTVGGFPFLNDACRGRRKLRPVVQGARLLLASFPESIHIIYCYCAVQSRKIKSPSPTMTSTHMDKAGKTGQASPAEGDRTCLTEPPPQKKNHPTNAFPYVAFPAWKHHIKTGLSKYLEILQGGNELGGYF